MLDTKDIKSIYCRIRYRSGDGKDDEKETELREHIVQVARNDKDYYGIVEIIEDRNIIVFKTDCLEVTISKSVGAIQSKEIKESTFDSFIRLLSLFETVASPETDFNVNFSIRIDVRGNFKKILQHHSKNFRKSRFYFNAMEICLKKHKDTGPNSIEIYDKRLTIVVTGCFNFSEVCSRGECNTETTQLAIDMINDLYNSFCEEYNEML